MPKQLVRVSCIAFLASRFFASLLPVVHYCLELFLFAGVVVVGLCPCFIACLLVDLSVCPHACLLSLSLSVCLWVCLSVGVCVYLWVCPWGGFADGVAACIVFGC